MNVDTLATDVFKSIGLILKSEYAAEIPVYFEDYGEDQISDKVTSFLEVRLDGPVVNEVSLGTFKVEVDIDILIVVEKTRDVFKIRNLMGKLTNTLNHSEFEVKQSNITIGKLSTSGFHGHTEPVRAEYYGQIDKSKNVLKASVSTTLTMVV